MTYKLSITFLDEWKISTRKNLARVAANQQNRLRSRRLEVVGERENGRVQGRHALPSRVFFSRARFFLCPLLPSACYASYQENGPGFRKYAGESDENCVTWSSLHQYINNQQYCQLSLPKVTVAQKCHGNFNLFTAISIYSRQFQFYSQQFQFAHDNFNLLTAISTLLTAISIFFPATRLAHGIFRFAHHLSATADDSGHQKSKRKIESRYLKSILKVKSENQKSKVDLRTLMPVASE